MGSRFVEINFFIKANNVFIGGLGYIKTVSKCKQILFYPLNSQAYFWRAKRKKSIVVLYIYFYVPWMGSSNVLRN